MANLRQIVLRNFKKLHRTRLKVFNGDERLLNAGRLKINEEFRKHKSVKSLESIKALLQLGEDVEKELRTQIIQAREVRPGVYRAIITEDTQKLDNIPYKELTDVKKGPVSSCQSQNKGK